MAEESLGGKAANAYRHERDSNATVACRINHTVFHCVLVPTETCTLWPVGIHKILLDNVDQFSDYTDG